MDKLKIVLVKPHPPYEVLEKKCPIPEAYKYAWEPIVLKLISVNLVKKFGEKVDVDIWHLINKEDDDKFINFIQKTIPDIVIFSEIDVLVNEVSKLAVKVKEISKDILTIVGGKQTSILRKGDILPFDGIDYALRGDGIYGYEKFVDYLFNDKDVSDIEGLIFWDDNKKIVSEDSFSPRRCHDTIDNIEIHKTPVKNHDLKEYITKYQSHATIIDSDNIMTSPLYIGEGCPHNCHFCQSPIEYGKVGKTILSKPSMVADEIYYLYKEHNVNNFFSLEPNMNLNNLIQIYNELEKRGIEYVPISGFIRAGDISVFYKKGILQKLIKKGVRVLCIGLDIPIETEEDVFNKNFTYMDMIECLRICKENGIIVLSTIVGDPELTRDEFEKTLNNVKKLPIAEVDVRLIIALRNTEYYKYVKDNLIYKPDLDKKYFDRQNYRYQTVQFKDKITPAETYELVNKFNKEFLISDEHVKYITDMIEKFPDTLPYFKRFYKSKLISYPDLKQLLPKDLSEKIF